MSEVVESFAAKVYRTFRAINIESHITQKAIGGGKRFDYLPWAAAWERVLETFPDSEFEFDHPAEIGAGYEIWVTVRIKEGDSVLERKWWLPILDYSNKPVAAPTALQINNTRMRVLVKCLAMCGLGTELYTGEDVPDKEHDAKVQGKRGVVADALEGVEYDAAEADGHAATIKAAMFNNDDDGLLDALNRISDNDMKIGVWSRLDSKTRSKIKALQKERA